MTRLYVFKCGCFVTVLFVHQRASDLHVLSRLLGAEGAKGEVVLVSPTPVDEDNKLKVSIVVKDGGELFGIFMSSYTLAYIPTTHTYQRFIFKNMLKKAVFFYSPKTWQRSDVSSRPNPVQNDNAITYCMVVPSSGQF